VQQTNNFGQKDEVMWNRRRTAASQLDQRTEVGHEHGRDAGVVVKATNRT
jgi:hypothetical protein